MNKQSYNKNGQKAAQMQAYKQALKRNKPFALPDTDKKIVASLGWSSAYVGRLHGYFNPQNWHEVRIDAETDTQADLLQHPHNLPMIADSSVDGVYIGHVLHRYSFHEAKLILQEAVRIMKDGGVLIASVPDLQLASIYAANDEMEAAIYTSPAGGITALDMTFGFQKFVATGDAARQHRSGYSLASFGNFLRDAGLSNLNITRQAYDLQGVGLKLPYGHPERVERIMLQTEPANRPNAPAIPAPAAAQTTAVRYADLLEGEPQRWKPLNLKK
jgi:hypothetical protein